MKSNSDTDPETTFQKLTPATSGHGTGEERPAGWNMLDDSLAANQRWSTWNNVERLMRGPEPRPEFIIEDAGAIDTELGVLKTGKEADVFLLERATRTRHSLLAAKRYRTPEQRSFRRSGIYTQGRTVRSSRDSRALKNGTAYGRHIEAAQWAAAEWNFLVQAYQAGIPVPYPAQVDGTEILMEFIADPGHPGAAAPRLHQLRPTRPLLESYFDQILEAMHGFASLGYTHGDLSPYNVLAAGSRLVIIDLPQLVDLAANPLGADLLARDCRNICAWFTGRGLTRDPEKMLAELLTTAWS